MFFRFLPHFIRCYLKKTPKIDERKILKDVVVSFTTTPVRIQKIWPTIHSILLQSKLPSKIYLWIPKYYKRFNDMAVTEVPEFLQNNPLVQVKFIDHDWGPATKLLPCLEYFKNQPETRIIIVDDDRIYHPHVMQHLTEYSDQDPHVAVTIRGVDVIAGKKQEYKGSDVIKSVDVLLGLDAYLVKPRFFNSDVFKYPEAVPEAFFEDDVWISGHLKRNGIKRMMVASQSSEQNIKTQGAKTAGLFIHENYNGVNFFKTWDYFSQL